MHPRTFLFLIIVLISSFLHGQESIHLLNKAYLFPTGEDHFDLDLFGQVMANLEYQTEIDDAIELVSRSSFELDETRAIDLLLESVARTTDKYQKYMLFRDIADQYFAQSAYKQAKQFYLKIDPDQLQESSDHQTFFNLGYLYLLEKNFVDAEQYFNRVLEQPNSLIAHASYYNGIATYYQGRQDEALRYFEKVANHPRYSDLVPYYFAQIHFQNKAYDQVIAYGTSSLENIREKDKGTLHRMMGLSYLALNNDREALKYLELYEGSTNKLTENEFYQLGLLNYKKEEYEKASKYLKETSHQKTQIGQMSNYLLGAISLDLNKKPDARSAFLQASKTAFFPDIKEESEYLYYKISAELGEDRTAILGLSSISASSPHYNEAQNLLAQLLQNSSDHKVAIQTIEGLPAKTPALLKVYQELAYNTGLRSLQSDNWEEARLFFRKSRDVETNRALNQKAIFWEAYMDHENGDHVMSSRNLKAYLSGNETTYKSEANYYLAYQAVAIGDHDAAIDNFARSIESYSRGTGNKVLYEDAILRSGDLNLIQNNYSEALRNYDKAIAEGVPQADYILFQKAIVLGVTGDVYDKLTNLESLIKTYPESSYKDDAMFEIGEALIELGKANEAYQIFDGLTSSYKDSEFVPKAYLRKGLISFNQGDMEASLISYENALLQTEDKEEQREALMAMEEIYLNELNNPQAYFKFLESEIGYEYEDITKDSISYEVAHEQYTQGKYEKAITLFSDYLKKFDDAFFKDDALYYQAESNVLLKRYDQGLILYEEVIASKAPEYHNSSLRKAALIAYNHTQDFNKSFKYYDQLLTLTNGNEIEYIEAALYSAFNTKNDQGIYDYAYKLTSHTDADRASKATAYYYLAKRNDRLGLVAESIDAYQKVIEHSTNHQGAEASYRKAELYFAQENYASAESQAFETTKRAGQYPIYVAKSLILLGDIYVLKEDYLNAAAAYESVIDNFTEDPKINTEASERRTELETIIELNSRVMQAEDQLIIKNDTLGNE